MDSNTNQIQWLLDQRRVFQLQNLPVSFIMRVDKSEQKCQGDHEVETNKINKSNAIILK